MFATNLLMPNGGSSDVADESPDRRGAFETTHWSVVLDAADENSPRAKTALESLCRAYWSPLVAYVKQRGHAPADAEDLVQGFFARILERNDLRAVRRERGRFRSYLLGGLKHYMINEWKRAGAGKRGGGQVAVPLDELGTASAQELMSDFRSPDRAFDREWAIALLARVLNRLREDYRDDGKEPLFEALQDSLTGRDSRPQWEIAQAFGLSEGAVKQAGFRLRQRYQKLLRAEVAQTVATFGDVEVELRYLIAALRS